MREEMREPALDRFEEILVVVGFSVSSAMAFINVVLRYTFGVTWAWGEDAVIVLIIWSVFVGSAIAVRRHHHIRVEVVVDLMSLRLQHAIRILTDVVCLGFALFVIFYGIQYDIFLYRADIVPVASLNIPEYLLFLCVPLGGLLIGIRYAQELWARLNRGFSPTSA